MTFQARDMAAVEGRGHLVGTGKHLYTLSHFADLSFGKSIIFNYEFHSDVCMNFTYVYV